MGCGVQDPRLSLSRRGVPLRAKKEQLQGLRPLTCKPGHNPAVTVLHVPFAQAIFADVDMVHTIHLGQIMALFVFQIKVLATF